MAQSRDGWQCLVCGRSATTCQGAKRLALSACKGHTACRVKVQGNSPSRHILWAAEAERAQTGTLAPDLIWRGKCAAYSSARVYNLAMECREVPEKSARTRLAAINMRMHPVHRHRLGPPVRLTDEVIRALGHGAEQRRRAFNRLLRGDPGADARIALENVESGALDATVAGEPPERQVQCPPTPAPPDGDAEDETFETDEDVFGHGGALKNFEDLDTVRDAKRRRLHGSGAGEATNGGGRSRAREPPQMAELGEHNGGHTLSENLSGPAVKRFRRAVDHDAERRAVVDVDGLTDVLPGAEVHLHGVEAARGTSRRESEAMHASSATAHERQPTTCLTGASGSNALRPPPAPALASIGDRHRVGRAASSGLSQPIPASHARDDMAGHPPDQREVKRRRIRGKQPPTSLMPSSGLHTASGPARPVLVDQHGASSSCP